MKLLTTVLLFIAFLSCKEAPKEVKTEMTTPEMSAKTMETKYPEVLNKVFEAHGGIANWKNKKTLTFVLPKEDAAETHTIDLINRKEKITTPHFSTGHDGAAVWLLDEKKAYKGDPIFYHNLMFYFYAMPFVLGDDGINYSETEDLVFEGKTYPGIRISYNDGVGASPKDEYFVHYDPKTYQMQWLGYTVTYRSGEVSDNVRWVRYNDWMTVETIVLPKSLTWHEYEGKEIKAARSTLSFENVSLSEIVQPDSFFAKPENAKIAEAK